MIIFFFYYFEFVVVFVDICVKFKCILNKLFFKLCSFKRC